MNLGTLPATWEWHIASDHEAASAFAADRLHTALREKPDLLLCAATGSSPTLTYQRFVEATLAEQQQAAAELRILKLDEWGGLPADDPATCETYLHEHLVGPLRISPDRFIGFQSDASPPEEECARVGAWLAGNGPIDVCVLGLGLNGHLGFNEPATSLTDDCHVADLQPESLAHSMLTATNRQPSHGLTLGMRDILASRTIVLLVFGEAKAEQLRRLATGGLSAEFPASFLSLHQQVVVVCDAAAAARL